MHRRILITGGSGYLGAELVRQALRQQRHVIATFHSRPGATGLGEPAPLVWHRLDLRDHAATEQLITTSRPDAIIHTAYRQDGPDLHTITATSAGVVARAAQQIGARLIHLSSDVIFNGEADRPYTEADPPDPLTAYGAAKAEAERLVAQACPAALIVRTSLIYGGDQLSKHEQLVLDAADERSDVAFFTDEVRCPVLVADLAAALLELTDRELHGILHVAGAECVSRYEFARLVALAHGRDPGRLRAASSFASGLRRPRNCTLNIQQAQRQLQTRLRGISTCLSSGGDQ